MRPCHRSRGLRLSDAVNYLSSSSVRRRSINVVLVVIMEQSLYFYLLWNIQGLCGFILTHLRLCVPISCRFFRASHWVCVHNEARERYDGRALATLPYTCAPCCLSCANEYVLCRLGGRRKTMSQEIALLQSDLRAKGARLAIIEWVTSCSCAGVQVQVSEKYEKIFLR